MRQSTPAQARFWKYVEDGDPDQCWEWKGKSRRNGYGAIGAGRRGYPTIYAHRLSYEIHYGPIPDGLLVLHRCATRDCVNPDHLYAGTYSDNLHDRYELDKQLKKVAS